LLALPAFIPCLLMFALPRYRIQDGSGRSLAIAAEPQPVEIAQ
jgi:hypothetical protein